MAQIPLPLVLAMIAIGIGEWPAVNAWSEVSILHHALVHGLFAFAGALAGFQTAWWTRRAEDSAFTQHEDSDSEVIS
ncbi:hypothetical protein Alches_04090 [Alicyclobacillus hesperidum subsp. aegles]|uniref:hypothetical protein n=1 Tax=Alicyclobacillus hesperidum TaxID=89784 RepID=UPI0009FA0275|nr:hypothetical protein [Alicyclobacillus hesperidum]GLG00370.1 hypothetical protein Alches_04090 [Alicyclobacillus hesperidum subsp. aegles]